MATTLAWRISSSRISHGVDRQLHRRAGRRSVPGNLISSKVMRKGGEILIDGLIQFGVDTAFCVPGESYLAALDAIYDRSDRLRLITQPPSMFPRTACTGAMAPNASSTS